MWPITAWLFEIIYVGAVKLRYYAKICLPRTENAFGQKSNDPYDAASKLNRSFTMNMLTWLRAKSDVMRTLTVVSMTINEWFTLQLAYTNCVHKFAENGVLANGVTTNSFRSITINRAFIVSASKRKVTSGQWVTSYKPSVKPVRNMLTRRAYRLC